MYTIFTMEDNHQVYMRAALEQAGLAKRDGERPFGAVVVRHGEIVAVGRCREDKLQTVLAHAETEAVDSACKKLGTNNLSDCTIYTTNEPCPMCSAVIFQAKIPRVIIGASRDDLPFLRPRQIGTQTLADDSGYDITIIRDVCRQEVLELFGSD